MKIEIICNEKGTGKTTFALKKYIPHHYFSKDVISDSDKLDESHNTYCIIDSVESFPPSILDNLMNKLISVKWKAIILIFDLSKEQLVDDTNFNMIWKAGIIPRNYKYTNFFADKNDFYLYLGEDFPELNKSSYDKIVELAGYNFNNINRLMLFNNIYNENAEEVDIRALSRYINEHIQIKYKDIPDADILLQKASIIGEKFACDALESQDGFGYDAASDYIKKMEELHGFIKKCMDKNYEFISHDVYVGIFDSISNVNKQNWVKVLIQYYKEQYKQCKSDTKQIEILLQLNKLYKLLPTCMVARKSVCFLLLYQYRKLNQTYYALQIAREIIDDLGTVTNPSERAFVQNYQIQILMQMGEYAQALEIICTINDTDPYIGSKMLIRYYYAYCSFQTGNIDQAYTITNELVDYLKNTSGSNNHPQELFCMTYSLMATLQNHLDIDDGGLRYFDLALNHASKLENSKYKFDILKKCDMFYSYEKLKANLLKCVEFYEQSNDWDSAGEVYVNLATEMMFQDCKNAKNIKKYFEKAINYFSVNNSKKLAYAKNNYGIYFIIVENDIEKGLKYLNEALMVGLSDFTYMSVYLNICMCYLLLNEVHSEEFETMYSHFLLAKKKLNKREHASKYEDIYENILNVLINEHLGQNVEKDCINILNTIGNNIFYEPLLNDIINRSHGKIDSCYKENSFFYNRMNQLHCFLAEFRFWE